MKNKFAAVLSSIVIVLLVASYYLIYFKLDTLNDFLLYDVVEPVFFGTLFLIVPLMIMIFMRRQIMDKWLKLFISWFLPLSVILILIVPGTSHEALSLTPDKEITTWILGSIYLVVSLGIIVYQTLKSRKNTE